MLCAWASTKSKGKNLTNYSANENLSLTKAWTYNSHTLQFKTIYSVRGQWKILTKTNNSIDSKNKGQAHVKEKQKHDSKNSNN